MTAGSPSQARHHRLLPSTVLSCTQVRVVETPSVQETNLRWLLDWYARLHAIKIPNSRILTFSFWTSFSVADKLHIWSLEYYIRCYRSGATVLFFHTWDTSSAVHEHKDHPSKSPGYAQQPNSITTRVATCPDHSRHGDVQKQQRSHEFRNHGSVQRPPPQLSCIY